MFACRYLRLTDEVSSAYKPPSVPDEASGLSPILGGRNRKEPPRAPSAPPAQRNRPGADRVGQSAGRPIRRSARGRAFQRRLRAFCPGHAFGAHRSPERRHPGVPLHRAPWRANAPVAQPDCPSRHVGGGRRRGWAVSRAAYGQPRATTRHAAVRDRRSRVARLSRRSVRSAALPPTGSRAGVSLSHLAALLPPGARGWRETPAGGPVANRSGVSRGRVARTGQRAVQVRHEDVVPAGRQRGGRSVARVCRRQAAR